MGDKQIFGGHFIVDTTDLCFRKYYHVQCFIAARSTSIYIISADFIQDRSLNLLITITIWNFKLRLFRTYTAMNSDVN